MVMGRAAKRIRDKRLLKLLRAFLRAGVMENSLVSPPVAGMPQGSPLSPLLSNLILDELDQELTRRGLRFCRYADDSNIYVRSQRAGERVMHSISRFLKKRLRLTVNWPKSAVAPVGGAVFSASVSEGKGRCNAISRRKRSSGSKLGCGPWRGAPWE
jgi:RNA-directed DNA polymerase